MIEVRIPWHIVRPHARPIVAEQHREPAKVVEAVVPLLDELAKMARNVIAHERLEHARVRAEEIDAAGIGGDR